jgi:membrane-associated phospholipid phosphatase
LRGEGQGEGPLILIGAFVALFLVLWAVAYALLPVSRSGTSLGSGLIDRLSARYERVGGLTNRFKAYVPVAVILVAGGLLCAWAADNFIDLAEMVHASSPKLQHIDTSIHAWAISRRSPAATSFFSLMSTIGGPVGLAILVAVVIIALLFLRRFRWVLYLIVTVGGGALLSLELKRYFARARPDLAEMLRQAHGYSFPSGHAMGSTVVFGALSYLAFRTAPRWSVKTAALALGITLVIAISLSRVYLGVHWISDVIAGITAGTLWVAITTVAYETGRRVRSLRALQRESRSSSLDARGA